MERDQITKSIKIHNASMVDELLVRFNMSNSRRVSTPLLQGAVLDRWASLSTEEQMEMNNKPSRELIGALIHLSNTVRPDIAFADNCISPFMESPETSYWNAAKHIMNYLEYTRDMGVSFRKRWNTSIGYSDADFAGDRVTRRSTSGYTFIYAGGYSLA